ncbi:MAG: glycosyltransferase family 2 protein [Planctomycetaceae bacterium]|jgi:glycosyltransferase involved in cell wall biosynthesis|nr:glycosyltransferase family 2 protein [Planctomycetaceae bacterium]
MNDQYQPIPISVCVLAKNCETKIERCLKPLTAFDDVLVLDTGSTDRTLDIIASFSNVRVFYQNGISNFGETRNFITEKAKYDWVLHIDSDEFITLEFLEEIRNLVLDANTVYSIHRRMFYRGYSLPPFDAKSCRLYHRRTTSWTTRAVHEIIDVREGMTSRPIKAIIEHHSYDSVKQLIDKAQYYSTLFAEQFHEETKTCLWSPFLHGVGSFLKFYILRGAIFYGYPGYLFSFCFSVGSFLKYAKLLEYKKISDSNRK